MANQSTPEPVKSRDIGEALRQSEERFRLLVESVRDYAIFMLDPNGVVITWNAGAARIKGYSEQQVIGKHFSVFYSAEDLAADKPGRELRIAMETGAVEDEGWRIRADGSRFWASVVITTLYDASGQHVGFAKVTRDMTDRRRQEDADRLRATQQLAESEERFASFAEHLPGLAWIKDLEGRYVYINEAAERMFGHGREEVYGRTDEELFPPDTAAEFRKNDQRALAVDTGLVVTEHHRDSAGMLRHSLVSKFPIPDAKGQVHLLGGVAVDITERVAAEEALQQADRRKNDFLATLSHELRNPLAPIRNGFQLLRSGIDETQRARVFRMVDTQVGHLVRLIDDLLDVSRITSGKVELRREAVDLRDVVQSAVDASGPLISSKEHALITALPDEPVLIHGDPVRLVQVVSNLLNNAAKYTPDGRHIWLTLRREGFGAVISVRDDGIGIPADMLPRVFDMFAQVDRTLKRSQGGLGIGLALARSLVEMHSGQIEVRSGGLDQGSEFIVRFALADRRSVRRQDAPRLPGVSLSRRILIADDNRDAADSLCLLLTEMKADARAAYDGASALEMIRRWRPAIALLDIGMPGMDGYEVAERVRAEPGLVGMRLIALTGWGSSEDRDRSRSAGFDEHWVKPVDPRILSDLLVRE
jgi:PAS domain S-box-containing protein